MNMGIDEARECGFVASLYHSGSSRDVDRAFFSDRFNSLSLDHNDGVFNRIAAVAVDQETHFYNRWPFLRRTYWDNSQPGNDQK
jgi:hypothetical protein